MEHNIVQDSDEDENGSSIPSPTKNGNGVAGYIEGSRSLKSSHNTSAGSTDDTRSKIDDIQKALLYSTTGNNGVDVTSFGYASLPLSDFEATRMRKQMLHGAHNSVSNLNENNFLLEGNESGVDGRNDTYHDDNTGASAFLDDGDIVNRASVNQTNDQLESLTDGSSTIPYGSLTQRRIVDEAVADLHNTSVYKPQVETKTLTGLRHEGQDSWSPQTIPSLSQESNKLSKPSTLTSSTSKCRRKDLENRPSPPRPAILQKETSEDSDEGSKPKSISNCKLRREKRYQTVPAYGTLHVPDEGDDKLCCQAGILSSNPVSKDKKSALKPGAKLHRTSEYIDVEPDDINALDDTPVVHADEPSSIVPQECYNPKPSRSRSRRIELEDVDYSIRPEREAKRKLKRNKAARSRSKSSIPRVKCESDNEGSRTCEQSIRKSISSTPFSPQNHSTALNQKLVTMTEMGFDFHKSEEALKHQRGNVDKAVQHLIEENSSAFVQNEVHVGAMKETNSDAPRVNRRRHLRRNSSKAVDHQWQEREDSDLNGTASNQELREENEDKFEDRRELSESATYMLTEQTKKETQSEHTFTEVTTDIISVSAENQNDKKKGRGRPRKKPRVEDVRIDQVEDESVSENMQNTEDLRVTYQRPTTPLKDRHFNSLKAQEGPPHEPDPIKSPRTPTTAGANGLSSSPATVENPDNLCKKDRIRKANHSPLSKSHVPYRVGLSRAARITPLLRSVKK